MSSIKLSLHSFAADAAERLAAIAQGIGQSVERTFSPALAAELWLIGQQLREREKSDTPLDDLRSRLLKLLGNLERLCKPSSSQTPQRQKLTLKVDGSDLACRFPGIALLRQDNRKYALDGIRRLASGKSPETLKRQQALIRMLQGFSGLLSAAAQSSISESSGNSETWTGHDFTSSVRLLYKVVASYTSCKVGTKDSQISAKLRLATPKTSNADTPSFGLMFLAHPHNEHDWGSLRWRETRIAIERKRRARFRPATVDAAKAVLDGPLIITDLCERISTGDQYQLSLKVAEEKLQFIEWCEGARSWVPDSPAVSLETILRNHTLSTKMKLILSFLLAKSVWQFYHTGWMGKEWTKESINFMFERRGNPNSAGVYLNEPFVTSRFDSEPLVDDSRFRPHKFPKIKALGILLLEIELGMAIEDSFRPDYFGTDGRINADADLYAALELYDNGDGLEDTFPQLKTAIGDCLRPTTFLAHGSSVEEIRTAVQKHVVDQLYSLAGLYGEPEKLELRPTVTMDYCRVPATTLGKRSQFRPSVKEEDLIHRQSHPGYDKIADAAQSGANQSRIQAPISDRLKAPRTGKLIGSVSSSVQQASAEDWFDDLDRLNEVICSIPGEVDHGYRKVRVAVIDTGMDGHDAYAKHIHSYKDFVTGNDQVQIDNTGHGTNSVKLIFKVYDQAEVYVARVFEHSEASENTQDLMLEAIEHASEVWKADIISIASGLERDHMETRRAIKRAATDGILIFAAASNYGNIRHVTFPARMQDVICIFCTDGRAKVSSSINPAPQTTKAKNFAILGEGVMVPPSTTDRITGTSVATCIAAGLAGRLLDFSRHSDCQKRIRCVENLASVEGISAVFAHMAKGAEDNRYNCVVPGRLLQHLDDNEARHAKRARVCERLSTALENIDREA